MIVKHDETWKSFKFVLTTDLISGIYLNTHLKKKQNTGFWDERIRGAEMLTYFWVLGLISAAVC